MFTGIIQAQGYIKRIDVRNGDWRLTVAVGELDMTDVAMGDSIATQGVCLTAVEFNANEFVADVSAETLKVTTLGDLKIGSKVNLEKALRLQDRLGGHLVSGHVDGVGLVKTISQDARSWRYLIEAPVEIARYIAHKGSVCINGVSLTVNQVSGCEFDVNIVPHTREKTTIREWQVGSRLNLEVDLLARYLERLISGPNAEGEKQAKPAVITETLLAQAGYL
ncbi:riboflavin synthase [Thiomicrospira microaerophila]|uniref:riboflavin synthase n=1 Tax=Thiomicrospira microaerophila TaxID=406020 RepID=UPI00200DC30B|nr:riboflavin synthase [Thiomicrospira microaerophila]UQB41481.1 riboflavin synthase [Thiomicrospira microaerophila]